MKTGGVEEMDCETLKKEGKGGRVKKERWER